VTGCGSDDILDSAIRAFAEPGDRLAFCAPTFAMIPIFARLNGVEPVAVPMTAAWDIDSDALATTDARIIYVCSPNNPTGTAQRRETIADLAERAEGLVIVDEAYVDFGGESALSLVADHPNVAIVRTFSKSFALAGARIGYVLAAPEVVGDLERVRLPYHLSTLTQAAGVVALRHADEAAGALAAIRTERDRTARELSKIDGVTVHPSEANFVLFEPPGEAAEVWRGLLDRGVLVRDLSAVVPNALRVTAGTTHEVDLFLKALEEVLAE
jgi:histidinol-phosphate aminotransferase